WTARRDESDIADSACLPGARVWVETTESPPSSGNARRPRPGKAPAVPQGAADRHRRSRGYRSADIAHSGVVEDNARRKSFPAAHEPALRARESAGSKAMDRIAGRRCSPIVSAPRW